MAGIIISEGSAKNHALFGEVQYPIASFLESRIEAVENQSIAKKITREVKSNGHSEGYSGLTTADDFKATPENGEYPHTDFEVAYTKQIVNITWKNSFSVSREMLDDSNFKEIFKRAAGMSRSYNRTREKFFFQMLGTALQGKTSFKQDDMVIDTTSYDGLPMFSNAHKGKISKQKISNAYTDAFSEETLAELATRMQNFTDENGNVLDIQPDTILIPNIASLKKQVFAVVGSERVPGSANNDYNYLFGNWNVWVSPYLNQFIGDLAAPFIVLDSRMVQEEDVFIRQEREPLNVTSKIERNDANTWDGRCRFGGGFVDFRGMVAGGLAAGDSI